MPQFLLVFGKLILVGRVALLSADGLVVRVLSLLFRRCYTCLGWVGLALAVREAQERGGGSGKGGRTSVSDWLMTLEGGEEVRRAEIAVKTKGKLR